MARPKTAKRVDPRRQAMLDREAAAAMRELIVRIPRRQPYSAEPELVFVPRRARAARKVGARKAGA